jgi:hypothetical protein
MEYLTKTAHTCKFPYGTVKNLKKLGINEDIILNIDSLIKMKNKTQRELNYPSDFTSCPYLMISDPKDTGDQMNRTYDLVDTDEWTCDYYQSQEWRTGNSYFTNFDGVLHLDMYKIVYKFKNTPIFSVFVRFSTERGYNFIQFKFSKIN